jgi:N-acetyltransferase
MIKVEPVVLERDGIILEPLELTHADLLRDAAADGQLWRLTYTSVPDPEGTRAYIETALQGRSKGDRIAWIVREKATGRALGCTSYHDIVSAADRVEIGYTWYRQSQQRTGLNTICKLMLMHHAFDTLGCQVVGWRTGILNHRSQRAIERLGAARDGVIRHHALRRDGSVRDTVIYSMLRQDWGKARAQLEQRLVAGPTNSISAQVELVQLNTETKRNQAIKCDAGALGQRMVASNAGSIAQAALVPFSWLRGVEVDNKIVGLVLLCDPTISPYTDPDDDPSMMYVWRFMIDFAHQHRGFGGIAMQKVIEYARSRAGIKSIGLSYVPEAGNARAFYERFGFVATDKIFKGEHEMILVL